MNKRDAERAIIANRPGEPFVLIERVEGEDISDLNALDWQADTDPPGWKEVQNWVAVLPRLPADVGAADQHRAQIVGENLEAAGVTQESLPVIYQQLLGQAKAGIPWYEQYTGGANPTPEQLSAAWAAFQALDQPTKDRILFNCCRTLAAMMRFQTGDLA